MSDQERADFYQEHKDDGEVWGEEVWTAAGPTRGPLGATITVRLPADDAAMLRNAAKLLDVSYSELVRKAVDAYLRPSFTIQPGSARVDLWAAMATAAGRQRKEPEFSPETRPQSTTGLARNLAKSA